MEQLTTIQEARKKGECPGNCENCKRGKTFLKLGFKGADYRRK